MSEYFKDPDPQETQDWLDSLDGVIRHEGIQPVLGFLRIGILEIFTHRVPLSRVP